MGKKKKKDIIQLERESVIPILKHKLISALSERIENRSERDQFLKLCKRVEYTIRAWYLLHFEELMQLYALFEPVYGAKKLEQQELSPEEIEELEMKFLSCLFQVMEKSNFKTTTDEEIEIALSAEYRLNLPIVVNEKKLDTKLFTRYFAENPHDNLPYFADKFIIFRRGFGIDQMTAYFIQAKIDTIIMRFWKCLMKVTGLKYILYRKRNPQGKNDQDSVAVDIEAEDEEENLYVERIRIEKMKLSNANLFKKVTIQEPTFERIIVVYRQATKKGKPEDRSIYIKHFKSIPMADLEIVLPEKQNPGLTPMDWVKFLVSAVIGLVTVVGSLSNPKADIKVIFAILTSVVGYCVKTYFTFQSNLVSYQSLITQSMYDKQLDSARGTLLHLCDEVIQQEVKEVIISFFVLTEKGKATRLELDRYCEDLIKEEFGESCNFEVDDAIQKLEKLGIVSQDRELKCYSSVDLDRANEIIGMTTEEVVLKAKDGADYSIHRT